MAHVVLVSGIPRAGKSSFCDAIEAAREGFTHVPLDRYVRPVPAATHFLNWIASPNCIAWDHLRSHLAILESGEPCYSPRPAWEGGWRSWISAGGAIADGPGRRMEPACRAYLVAGTHAFAFAAMPRPMRVFVHTPGEVIAERLTGTRVDPATAERVISRGLAPNTAAVRQDVHAADLVIDGTAHRSTQVREFLAAFTEFFAPSAPAP
ncbi:MAG: hypothetical protein KY467_02605 [Gemmatimonadetes bacterium]|nr:hypothetical protein [Gemmatimonadota bacterium]